MTTPLSATTASTPPASSSFNASGVDSKRLIAVLVLPSSLVTASSPVVPVCTPTLSFFRSSNLATLLFGLDGDQLLRVEVGVGEVHRLLALVGDRDRRDQHVAVALAERVEDAFPRRVDELHFDAGLLGRGVHHVDVEADDLALFVLRFERRVGGVGADHLAPWPVRAAGAAADAGAAARRRPAALSCRRRRAAGRRRARPAHCRNRRVVSNMMMVLEKS